MSEVWPVATHSLCGTTLTQPDQTLTIHLYVAADFEFQPILKINFYDRFFYAQNLHFRSEFFFGLIVQVSRKLSIFFPDRNI